MEERGGVLVQNEKHANKSVAKVMRITFLIFSIVFLLNVFGIFVVDKLAFYEISTHKMIDVELPGDLDKLELIGFIKQFKEYNPASTMLKVNPNKCMHCIYCNLCDKTDTDNVYT